MDERPELPRPGTVDVSQRALIDAIDLPAALLHVQATTATIVFANAAAWRSSGGLAAEGLPDLLQGLGLDATDATALLHAVVARRPGRWHGTGNAPAIVRLQPLPPRVGEPNRALLSWHHPDDAATAIRNGNPAQRLAAVFEAALEPMLLADDEARYVDANPSACAAFGLSREQMRQLSVADLVPPDHRERVLQTWPAFLARDHAEGRVQLCAAGGRLRTFEFRAVTNIRPGLHLSVLRDVTEIDRATAELVEREQQFRTLADHIPDPVFVLGLDGDDAGRILYVNRAAAAGYGYEEHELLGRSIVATLDAPQTAEHAQDRLARVRSGETITFEGWHRRKDGSLLPIEARACRLSWQGRPAILAIDRDIGERQREAAAMRENSERLRLAIDAGQFGMFDWDMLRGTITWSAFHYELFGYPADADFAVTYQHFRERIHPDDLAGLEAEVAAAVRERRRYQHEARVVRPDGSVRTFTGTGTVLRDQDDRPVRMLGFVQDVTERRAAEARTREQLAYEQQRQRLLSWLTNQPTASGDIRDLVRSLTERLAAVHECARVSFWRFTADGRTLVCDDCYDRASDRHDAGTVLHESEFPGTFAALHDRLYLDIDDVRTDPRTARLAAAHLLRQGISSRLEAVIRYGGRNHGTLCLEHVQRPHTWRRDEIDFACAVSSQLAVALEAIARTAAEARVRERERFLTAVLEGSPIGIQIFRPDGTSLRLNQAMQNVLGLPGSDGFVGAYNLLGDEQARATGLAAAFERCRRGESTSILRVEVDFERDDYRRWGKRTGTTWYDNVLFPVFAPSGAIEAVVVFTWDVAERVAAERTRRLLEDQLRQSQKLEAVGMLAGGVAHDFNNILTAVLGFAEALDGELPPEHPGREFGAQIQKAALRGARLTEQLLAFGKKQVVRAEVFDPAVLVEETTPMLRQLVGAEVRLDVATQRGNHVHTDKVQFQQVLMNLAVNARDAMPRGGTLQIAVQPHGEDHVLLRVRDTGVGMDEHVQARLFEPFFTTKEPGKGSGLGLATVYGIATRAGGSITVQSAPGAGACFDVSWPRVEALAETPAPPPPPAGQLRRARILLVEDDDANRELAARILRLHGHELLVAESGERALELAATAGDFEMLVTDVMMPGLSGRAVAERLCAQRPQLKVLFVSGYLADDELRSDVGLARAELLQKPFTANELLTTVQQVLAR